jgi:hypothetical protein
LTLYFHSRITANDSGFLIVLESLLLILEFQIAAPGGFSVFPAGPALTFSGFSVSSARRTRSHLGFLDLISSNYATETPDGQDRPLVYWTGCLSEGIEK